MSTSRANDEAAIRAIFDHLTDSWNNGDATAWTDPFADDVDFVIRDGSFVKGKQMLARGHQRFFDTFYRGTKYRSRIRSIRFLGDDVAVVHDETNIVRKDEEFPDEPKFRRVAVLSKDGGEWRIVVFQNTMVGEPI